MSRADDIETASGRVGRDDGTPRTRTEALIHLLGDDPESLHDIPALLDRLGLPPAEITKMDNGWLYVINRPEGDP